MADSITLPRSGIVLRRVEARHPTWCALGPSGVRLKQLGDMLPTETHQASCGYGWKNGLLDECIAWLDAPVLETRAALLVGDVVRDTIENAIADVETCTPGCLAPSDVVDIARAILRALGGGK